MALQQKKTPTILHKTIRRIIRIKSTQCNVKLGTEETQEKKVLKKKI